MASCYAVIKRVPSVKIVSEEQTNQRRDPMKHYDYTGKVIDVGIDVHKKTYSCVSICEGQIMKRDTMPANPEILLSYLRNKFSRAQSINTAYEAGFHLHRYLVSQGINNIVVHSGSIEISSRDRVRAFRVRLELLNFF